MEGRKGPHRLDLRAEEGAAVVAHRSVEVVADLHLHHTAEGEVAADLHRTAEGEVEAEVEIVEDLRRTEGEAEEADVVVVVVVRGAIIRRRSNFLLSLIKDK